MDENMTIREFQKRFLAGDFESPDRETQIEAGWYDWFCSDSALKRKTDRMGKVVARLTDSDKVNLDTMYVFFKNCCPMVGPLYDQFKICDLKTGEVLFCIDLGDQRQVKLWQVWDCRDNTPPAPGFDNSAELVKWLNRKEA